MKGLGGLARQVTFWRRVLADTTAGPRLRVSGGDLLFGHPAVVGAEVVAYWRRRGTLLGGMLAACGIEYAAVGDADLALGYAQARASLAPLGDRWISANLTPRPATDGATPGAASPPTPFAVVERGTVRIGLFSVLRRPPGDLPDGVAAIEDPIVAARRVVAALRERNCSIVVLLAHLGAHDDTELLQAVPGIDVAVCGCCPGPRQQPTRVGTTWYCSAMFGGGQVGRVDVLGRRPDGALDIRHRLYDMDRSLPADVGTQDTVRAFELSARAVAAASSSSASGGPAAADPPQAPARSFWGVDYCATCHDAQTTAWRATPHAMALDRLPPEGRANPECLECHTTGAGQSVNFALGGTTGLPGVQCEACHAVHPSHPRSGHGKVSTGVGDCYRCHTPVRSPSFDPRGAWRRAACPRSSGGMTLARTARGTDDGGSGT